ncbi:MAG: hypothetical protein ABI691_18845 [Ginsengibacter sp.]
MNEILLQTIVEKLEALEIALLKESNAGKDVEVPNELTIEFNFLQLELEKFTSISKSTSETISDLLKEINTVRLNLGNPVQNLVEHTHHFHKQIWITISLLVISLLLAYGWINNIHEKEAFKANDIKYRFWKTNGNASLLKITYSTDSLYTLDKNNFTKRVIQAELKIAEQEKAHRLAGEKKKEGIKK